MGELLAFPRDAAAALRRDPRRYHLVQFHGETERLVWEGDDLAALADNGRGLGDLDQLVIRDMRTGQQLWPDQWPPPLHPQGEDGRDG